MPSLLEELEAPSLLVGLGNIGEDYEGTRHNAGFDLLDLFASCLGAAFSPSVRLLGAHAKIGSLHLLKPSTLMNRSGASVAACVHYYKIASGRVFVAHDEMDLPLGTLRLKIGGGAGGHNGIRDVIKAVGNDFRRLRLGIGHPGSRDKVLDYVLSRFSKTQEAAMQELYASTMELLPLILTDFPKAQQQLHTSA